MRRAIRFFKDKGKETAREGDEEHAHLNPSSASSADVLRRIATGRETTTDQDGTSPVRALLDTPGKIKTKKAKALYDAAIPDLRGRFERLKNTQVIRSDGSIETFEARFNRYNAQTLQLYEKNEKMKHDVAYESAGTDRPTEKHSYQILQQGLRELESSVQQLLNPSSSGSNQ
jgi:hypothetical protein